MDASSASFACREVAFASAAHAATIALRRAVLRLPLGLDFTDADLAAEVTGHHHLACFAHHDPSAPLIACLVLTPTADGPIRLRQLAVSPAFQQRGAGRALVTFAEQFAHGRGHREIHLHARADVLPFYEKLDYTKVGPPFVELGLAHQAMQKTLTE